MCQAIASPNHSGAPELCPCAWKSPDTTDWCTECYLALCDLERQVGDIIPRHYTAHDVLVAALHQIQANALVNPTH